MATDRYESIIDVRYLGQRDVDRYISDLTRLGAITGEVASRLRASLAGGLGGDSAELANALRVGAARARDYDSATNRALASTDALRERVGRLRREMEGLASTMRQVQGAMTSGGQMNFEAGPNPYQLAAIRRQLYRVLEANAINQRIGRQLNPISLPTGPQPLALPASTMADRAREAAAAAQRRYDEAMERRFAAQAARGNELTGATLGPGGRIISATFVQDLTASARRADDLNRNIAALQRHIDQTTESFLRNTQAIGAANRAAEEYNRQILTARMMRDSAAPDAPIGGIPDELPAGNQRFWRTGEATRQVLQGYAMPEWRASLLGESSGDPLVEYRQELQRGGRISVPGMVSADQILRDQARERTSVSQAQINAMRTELDSLVVPRRDPIALGRGPAELAATLARQAEAARQLEAAERRRIETARELRAAEQRRSELERLAQGRVSQGPLALPAGSRPPLALPPGMSDAERAALQRRIDARQRLEAAAAGPAGPARLREAGPGPFDRAAQAERERVEAIRRAAREAEEDLRASIASRRALDAANRALIDARLAQARGDRTAAGGTASRPFSGASYYGGPSTPTIGGAGGAGGGGSTGVGGMWFGGGGPNSFGQQFRAGFVGANQRASYGEQLGQTFKFSLMYGSAYQILSGITSTLSATLQEGIAFQQGMTDLVIATGQTREELTGLAKELGDAAVAAGQAPSIGLQIAARAQGLYGVAEGSGATTEQQALTGRIAARVVTQESLVSGMDASQIQTTMAAITNAFGLGIQGLQYVADLDTYLSKQLGAPTGGTIQSVAESGSVARAAGYSLEETTSIAALLQGRTGQTPSAVAGYMAQIFSREGEAAFGALAQRYGANTNDPLSTKIDVLAQAYQGASSSEQSEISAAFGRGKVQNAVVALLEGYEEAIGAAGRARTEAGGSLQEMTSARLGDIGGQLQITLGVMRDFAGALGQTGILEVLGGLVLVFREFLESATALLRIWNEIPGPIRATIAGLIALNLAMRSTAVSNAVSGAAGALGLSRAAGVTALATRTAAGTALVTPVGGGAPVALASGAGARALAGNARAGINAMGAVAPLLAFTAVAYLGGTLKALSDRMRETADAGKDLLASGLGADATSPELSGRAAELDAQSAQIREANKGFLASVKNLGADKSENLGVADAMEAEADRLRQLATDVEAQALSVSSSQQLVSGFDADSLAESMDLITRTGGTATQQFNALAAALEGGGAQAARIAATFDPQIFASQQAAGIQDALAGAFTLMGTGDVSTKQTLGKLFVPGYDIKMDENIAPGLVRGAISIPDIQERLAAALGNRNLTDLGTEDLTAIASSVVGDAASQALGDTPANSADTIEQARQQMIAALVDVLQTEADNYRALIRTAKDDPLTSTELTNVIGQIAQAADAMRGQRAETDYAGKIRDSRRVIRQILTAIGRSSGETPAASLALANARRQLAQDQIAELEALRKAAQANARSKAQFRSIGRGFLAREINAAVKGRDADSLGDILSRAGSGAIDLARESIREAIQVAREALRVKVAMARAAAAARAALSGLMGVGGGGGFDPSKVGGAQRDTIKQLQQLQQSLNYVTPAQDGQDEYLDMPEDAGASGAEKETAAERRAARLSAMATRSESAIAAARAQIAGARAAMAKAEKGSVEYYSALEQYYAARNALTDAILDYRNNQYLLSIDMTDPLEMAQADLRAAQAKLRSDRGKGADVRAADQVALQNAQNALEATKFSQRLQSVQTAERLGRISHAAYIRYLENEQRRLESIKNRTYQQQQQLDEIDGLLQDAAKELQGQFNIGNINLPTPYEVRRYIEQQSGAEATRSLAAARTSVQAAQTTIYIDGADTAKVRQIIEQVTGKQARTTTTSPRRR